jgi:TIR domain
VSYNGKNAKTAEPIIAGLRQKFQQVFDYRADDRAIPAGSRWIEEIFKQIAARPLGVILLSSEYLDSGYCLHEMQEMIAQRDGGKMKIVPIKLGEVRAPPELASTQYLRATDFDDVNNIVAALIQDIDRVEVSNGSKSS